MQLEDQGFNTSIQEWPHRENWNQLEAMFENTSYEKDLNQSKPVWIRIPEAVRIFGISRTKPYMLINEGKFTSVSLRERYQTKGTRLINYESLNEYIHSCISKSPPSEPKVNAEEE
jgi:hypothetical protein